MADDMEKEHRNSLNLPRPKKMSLMEILSRSEGDHAEVRPKRENSNIAVSTFMESVKSSVPMPVPRKVISASLTEDGMAHILTEQDEHGKMYRRIQYGREQMLHLAESPFAILPPAAIKMIVANMSELIPPIPVRHGLDP